MKSLSKIALIVLVGILASCEDVIDLDLDKGQEQLTVEAVINTSEDAQKIILRGTIPFFDDINTTPAINNAEVFVNNGADTFRFTFDKEGEYVYQPSSQKKFEVGKEYELNVNVANEQYTALSTASPTAIWDSLVYEYKEGEGDLAFFQEGYYVFMYARDLQGPGNCYWFKNYINGEFLDDPFAINIAYDAGGNYGDFDGTSFSFPNSIAGVNDNENPYEKGDTVKIEIQGINPDFYYFLTEVFTQIDNGGLFASPPANVRTNIANRDANGLGAVGYFIIGESDSRQVIIE